MPLTHCTRLEAVIGNRLLVSCAIQVWGFHLVTEFSAWFPGFIYETADCCGLVHKVKLREKCVHTVGGKAWSENVTVDVSSRNLLIDNILLIFN